MNIYVSVGARECTGFRGQSQVSFDRFLPSFFVQRLSLNPKLTDSSRLVGQMVPGTLLSPYLQLRCSCLCGKHFSH